MKTQTCGYNYMLAQNLEMRESNYSDSMKNLTRIFFTATI